LGGRNRRGRATPHVVSTFFHFPSVAIAFHKAENRLAAVTCAVLAPAGPNRSRVLASLYRDERTLELPTYNILSKMFLDHILRPAEIKEFEKTLKPHQLAKLAISSNDRLASAGHDNGPDSVHEPPTSTRTGPATVLDRAVMEHNLLASSRIYNNITFRGLGALLDLTPGAAETMARKMIEQGRLKGTIDQVDKLIWFEGRQEDDAQGKAGGLGDVEQDTEDTGAPFTKRWDMQIRLVAANVSSSPVTFMTKDITLVGRLNLSWNT
jgi:COP9 signalosome complex subunit 4